MSYHEQVSGQLPFATEHNKPTVNKIYHDRRMSLGDRLCPAGLLLAGSPAATDGRWNDM